MSLKRDEHPLDDLLDHFDISDAPDAILQDAAVCCLSFLHVGTTQKAVKLIFANFFSFFWWLRVCAVVTSACFYGCG